MRSPARAGGGTHCSGVGTSIMKRAVYPGTFDPVTYGHLDIIRRGVNLVDELVVAVATNAEKRPLFSLAERIAMLKAATRGVPRLSIDHFAGMTVDAVRARKATVILRGIRTVADFESEFQMALTNRLLAPDLETIFVMASQEYSFLSSRLIKETASLGGDLSHFVPPVVETRLREKFGRRRGSR